MVYKENAIAKEVGLEKRSYAMRQQAMRENVASLLQRSNLQTKPVLHVYDTALKGFAVSGLSEAEVAELRRDEKVAYIVPDKIVSISADPKNGTKGIGTTQLSTKAINSPPLLPPGSACETSITINGVPNYVVGLASFGPANFSVSGQVILVDDGTAPITDACQPIVNNITGKIALIDRNVCEFGSKALVAQQAGAIGVIICNNVAGAAPNMGPGVDGGAVTIPVLSLTLADGNLLKTALTNGPVTAILHRPQIGVGSQCTPWGITRVHGGSSGAGKRAWILDTGIDLDHPDLNVNVGLSKSFVPSLPNPDDQHGHGTHVAGTIAAIDNAIGVIGVAAGAEVVAVRVLNAAGNGSEATVIAGVNYVAANAGPADVANMSLGGDAYQPLDDAVLALSAVCKVVLAAGNSAEDASNASPARTNGPNIYTVSAIDINDSFASFSNFGNPPVDYAAPGVNVASCWLNAGYNVISGTSMAAPHVAGLLLLGCISSKSKAINDPDGNPDPIAEVGNTLYVKANATGANNGSSWADAYTTLQAALASSCPTVTQIWVAKGTYFPDEGPGQTPNDRTSAFEMKNGITIYGGFPNSGNPGMGQRNWTANQTILSGDIDGTPDVVSGSGITLAIAGNGGNAIHVILNPTGLNNTAILDGFIVSGGNANVGVGTDISLRGGGMMNNGEGAGNFCNPTVRNCTFTHNVAFATGGGVNNRGLDGGASNPHISDCTFSENMATIAGGGVFSSGFNSSPVLLSVTRCVFTGNVVPNNVGGAGMYNNNVAGTVSNCSFTGNTAATAFGQGGGVFNTNCTSALQFLNCDFTNNTASYGAGLRNWSASPTITNCTFKGNQASTWGGGMLNYSSASPTVTNCIFLGNTATEGGGMANENNANPTVINCTFSGNSAASGGGLDNRLTSSPLLKNCIIWGNSSGVANHDGGSIPVYTNSLMQGLSLGAGIFNGSTDPLLVNQPPIGLGTTGNLHLKSCSPALNVGDNAANSTPKDLDNNTRKVGVIDLGAYEYQGQPFGVVASTAGNCASITLSTKITSGTPAYAYSWAATSGGNFTSSSSSPTAFTINNNPGNYAFTVTVNDGVGCTATATTSTALLNPTTQGTLSSNSPVTVGLVIDLKTSIFGGGYTWKGPDAWTSNLKDPSRGNAKLTMGGVYTLTVKGSNACTGTNTISVQVVPKSTREAAVEAENIERQAIDMEISAYPNPVTNTLTVEVRLAKPAAVTLELLNGLGEKNGQWKLTEESTFHKTEIDMTSLTGGMYLLQAQAGKQKVVKRVVKIQY